MLENDEWKNDIMPEILDGKNVADFIDADILEKLEALEREEEKLEADGFYDSESDMVRLFKFRICDHAKLVARWCSSTPTMNARLAKRRLRVRRSYYRKRRKRP